MKTALQRRWRWGRHSLRARLVGLFLALALAMTLTFVAGMQAVMRYGWQEVAEPMVTDYVDRLADEIGTPPDVARATALARRLPLRIRIEGPVVNWSSLPDTDRPPRREIDLHDAGHGWRSHRMLADGHRITFGLRHLPRDAAPEDRARWIGWSTLLGMLLLVGIVYGRVHRLLAPLADIRAGAIRYGAGDFSQPIPRRANDELGELALQVNGMADGLRQLLDAKRELLLAISHELRSPLTRARLNAELVDPGPARDALLRDLADMRDLIADLLESERLSGGHSALSTETLQLNALIEETLGHHFEGRAIALHLDPNLPWLRADASRMRLMLRNLLANAVRHGAVSDRPAEVRTACDGAHLVLTVRDYGPGVDPAVLPRLAQAFYRPDSARQRSTGGVGLGLYLCRLVAQAHGGTLSLQNARPGLDVQVRLPLATP
ncbi:MAG: HAMP domain-containing histidine kinase [Pseudomonadota bacterium]|nr:HAMP domain-containing histidine kinase [Pseudomonadota bacterium]